MVAEKSFDESYVYEPIYLKCGSILFFNFAQFLDPNPGFMLYGGEVQIYRHFHF